MVSRVHPFRYSLLSTGQLPRERQQRDGRRTELIGGCDNHRRDFPSIDHTLDHLPPPLQLAHLDQGARKIHYELVPSLG